MMVDPPPPKPPDDRIANLEANPNLDGFQLVVSKKNQKYNKHTTWQNINRTQKEILQSHIAHTKYQAVESFLNAQDFPTLEIGKNIPVKKKDRTAGFERATTKAPISPLPSSSRMEPNANSITKVSKAWKDVITGNQIPVDIPLAYYDTKLYDNLNCGQIILQIDMKT